MFHSQAHEAWSFCIIGRSYVDIVVCVIKLFFVVVLLLFCFVGFASFVCLVGLLWFWFFSFSRQGFSV